MFGIVGYLFFTTYQAYWVLILWGHYNGFYTEQIEYAIS